MSSSCCRPTCVFLFNTAVGLLGLQEDRVRRICTLYIEGVLFNTAIGRKHGALRPQKPLRLIRDLAVGRGGGCQEFLYLIPTRYAVTTRMTLH